MKTARAVLALVALLGGCVWIGHTGPSLPSRVLVATTIPTTSTTTASVALVAAPPPATAEPPRQSAPRASRSGSATRQRPTLTDEVRLRVEAAIASHDWDVALFIRIAGCESGLNPWAVNRSSGATGIFQILGATPGLIEEHVALAYRMWQKRGLSHWAESRRCWE